MSPGKERTILVLYTELAPYVLACLRALVERHAARVHLVRWPVNAEAPFNLNFHERITVHERSACSDTDLLALATKLDPDLVLASGWVDRGYLAVCRAMRRKGTPTVMTFDTAWRGGAKQWLSAALGRGWVPRTFSHAWATGTAQARYARNLGFPPGKIRTGFYAADIHPFREALVQARSQRAAHYPHRFVHVARYIPTKGQQVLCDAFTALCEAGRSGDWELHFVGTGELFGTVRNSPSGRHPRIVHQGFIQADEMPRFLADCGASVLPSLYEPWGVVVQEHACMGLPLLLSDAVGARERFLEEGVNGWVHRAGDREALQRSLSAIVGMSDAQLLHMGDRSAELGMKWTPEHWADVAVEFIERP